MARKTHHVVPDSNRGGWNIKRGGASKASKHFDTKVDAEKAARTISRNQRTELIIHGKNGKIQRSDSHSGDPYPPKG